MKARKGLNNVTKQLLNNGNKAYKRGDLDKATDFYKKATKYDETFYLAFYQLGVLEKKMGNSDMAITYLNKVINIKPDFQKAWFTLGTSYDIFLPVTSPYFLRKFTISSALALESSKKLN